MTGIANHIEHAYRGRRVMVTGGLGFIGSNLAHRLVRLGSEVLIVDALTPGCGGNWFNVERIRDRARIEVADLRNEAVMAELVLDQEIIFNLAGQVSHIDSMRDPMSDLENNVRAPLALLEACRLYNPTVKIVYASTRQIYGKPQCLPVGETHPTCPTDVNGVDKMAGEWFHHVYHTAHGMRASSLRLSNTFGPRQLFKHNRQGFLPWFVRLALDDREITLYGDGSQVRDPTYVDDVVDAFLRAGACDDADGEVFNLGGPEPISLRALATQIVEIAGRGSIRCIPWPDEKKVIDIGDFHADIAKARRVLGWQPTTGVTEGLERMIDYYRRYRRHYED